MFTLKSHSSFSENSLAHSKNLMSYSTNFKRICVFKQHIGSNVDRQFIECQSDLRTFGMWLYLDSEKCTKNVAEIKLVE